MKRSVTVFILILISLAACENTLVISVNVSDLLLLREGAEVRYVNAKARSAGISESEDVEKLVEIFPGIYNSSIVGRRNARIAEFDARLPVFGYDSVVSEEINKVPVYLLVNLADDGLQLSYHYNTEKVFEVRNWVADRFFEIIDLYSHKLKINLINDTDEFFFFVGRSVHSEAGNHPFDYDTQLAPNETTVLLVSDILNRAVASNDGNIYSVLIF